MVVSKRAIFVSQHTTKRSGNFLPVVVIHMPGFTASNLGKTINFTVTTVRLSTVHDLKVTDCSSFSFSQNIAHTIHMSLIRIQKIFR